MAMYFLDNYIIAAMKGGKNVTSVVDWGIIIIINRANRC